MITAHAIPSLSPHSEATWKDSISGTCQLSEDSRLPLSLADEALLSLANAPYLACPDTGEFDAAALPVPMGSEGCGE